MHRARSWNTRGPEIPYMIKYTENVQWNRRERSHFQGNTQQNFDNQHWCETCDKGFASVRFLENHKLQHQKCNIDGCQFVAHPNIITKHIQMQHSTGLFKKIAKLNNPEDIKKWREERKRKYPTLENITKKAAEIKEKIKRGEKMGMKLERGRRGPKTDFLRKTDQRLSQPHRPKYNQNNITNRKRVATDVIKKSNLPRKICETIPNIEESRTLKPFAGIQSIEIDDDLDENQQSEHHSSAPIEDDEDVHNALDIRQKVTLSEPAVCSALTSLMCCYGSSDEDDTKTNSESKDIKKTLNENNANGNDIKYNGNVQILESNVPNCPGGTDDDSGPEEIKISKDKTIFPMDNNEIPKTKLTKGLPCKKINGPSPKKYEFRKKRKLPSTLLEKLLHKEIQHERNVILQCVRYVVTNKYFENS